MSNTPFRIDVVKGNGASSSFVHDRMFPDSYAKNRDKLVVLCGPAVPLGLIASRKTHPLHDIIDAMLVLATCQELADGYSGAGYGMSAGPMYGSYIDELAGFVLGFHYGQPIGDHVSSADFVIPKRYFDLVQVVRTIRAMPTDPKKDPEYPTWLRLNQKFGKGPQE